MALDISRLEKVQRKGDGSIVARCPACVQDGHDKKGDHLIGYPDGRYGCVANPRDKTHNKLIMSLAGTHSAPDIPPLTVKRYVEAPPRPGVVVGHYGRQKSSPTTNGDAPTPLPLNVMKDDSNAMAG